MRPRRPNNRRRPNRRRKKKGLFVKKPDKIYFEGTIVETLPGVKFKVKIDRGENLEPLILTSDLKSFLKVKHVKIIKGDHVTIEVDPMDLEKGVIVNRSRN